MSWPDQAAQNGWLALDRNGNGIVDDFTEFFGNLTPQAPANDPNGYLALAVFDEEMNGGNGNGVIDPGDSVYDHLLVWVDANHNGISEPEELHTLRELGIFRIDLKYRESHYVDKNGNSFRYKARIWDNSDKPHDLCYDVSLTVEGQRIYGRVPMIRLSLAFAGLSCICLAAAAKGACPSLGDSQRSRLVDFIRREYRIPAVDDVHLMDEEIANDACYRKLIFQGRTAVKTWELTMFLSADGLFLSPELIDVRIDPLEELRRK